MQRRNNQLAVCAGALGAFVCALFVKWYTLSNAPITGGCFWPGLKVTGLNGDITLLCETPIWLLLAVSAFFTLLEAANLVGWTSVPWWVVAGGLFLPLVNYGAPFFIADQHLSVGVGPAVAVLATLAVLGVVSAGATVREPRAMVGTTAKNLWQ